jgi:HPt (histidine-containing phosphotransfer) domain-containing protein
LEGDRDLLSGLARLFLDDLPSQTEATHRAVEQRRGRDVQRLANGLKNSVANFAAKPAFEAAFRLEKLASQGDFEEAPQALGVLDHEIHRLQETLEKWTHKSLPCPEEGSSLIPPPPHAAASPSMDAG